MARAQISENEYVMTRNAVKGTWVGLDNGESGPIVDDSGITDSWDNATRDIDTDISWTCGPDDDGPDDDSVSVSVDLLDTLLAKARAYDACTCTCRRI